MKPEPLVSIIINNYNYRRFLREAIDSALQQNYQRIEVVVVDDGSTDGSREVIRGYGDRIIAVLKPNGGQGSAINAGFAAAHGDIICLEDSDDFFLPDKVRTVVETLAATPHAGWCYHAVSWVDVDRRPVRRDAACLESNSNIDLRRGIVTGRVRFLAPPTSGLSFRASLLRQILPMPESIDIVSDNYIKFASFGLAPGVFLATELACQRIHDNNAFTCKKGSEKEQTQARTKMLIAHALQAQFPDFRRFSDALFASSLASYWTCGGVDPKHSGLMKDYLRRAPLSSKCRVAARAIFYLCRIALKSAPSYAKYCHLSPHSPAPFGNLHS
jgi:hypothetical protein